RVILEDGSTGLLSNNQFVQNSWVECLESTMQFTNNIVTDCMDNAITFDNYTDDSFIYNNIFLRNIAVCYVLPDQENPTINASYNCFDDTLVYHTRNCTFVEEDNIVGISPLFENEVDFRLREESPCINAGHPNEAYHDVDGSRNDMGIYGGPYGEEYVYPGTLNSISELNIPQEFLVESPYPNPFNSMIQLRFAVPTQGEVAISIRNLLGRTVFSSEKIYSVGWETLLLENSTNWASGIYFIRLSYLNTHYTQKAVLLR
ncbi:T9SS type A sorting domain-containing protein, partial [bacterium]|nr:T9SS type A sorting domain-containing protein [bacterium]